MRKSTFGEMNDSRRNEEEKYEFIREQTRPEKKQRIHLFCKKLFSTAFTAIIFGILAGLAFVGVTSMFCDEKDVLKNDQEIGNVADVNYSDGTDVYEIEETPDINIDENGSSLDKYRLISQQLAAVGEKCNAFIVSVYESGVADTGNWFDEKRESSSKQCGVIFRKVGDSYYILTTTRNLSEQKNAEVVFENGERCSAKITGRDNDYGLAVLEIKKKELSSETQDTIKVARFGGSSNLAMGATVLGLGAPNGIMYSVETGMITNNDLNATITDGSVDLYSCSIGFCEEGSVIIANAKGKVVGIAVDNFNGIGGSTGYSFVALSKLNWLLGGLLEGEAREYFGIQGTNVDKRANDKVGISYGIYVTNVISRSPAYESGIRVSDIIVQVDDQRIENLQQFQSFLSEKEVGDKIVVRVKRGNKNKLTDKKFKITLG